MPRNMRQTRIKKSFFWIRQPFEAYRKKMKYKAGKSTARRKKFESMKGKLIRDVRKNCKTSAEKIW